MRLDSTEFIYYTDLLSSFNTEFPLFCRFSSFFVCLAFFSIYVVKEMAWCIRWYYLMHGELVRIWNTLVPTWTAWNIDNLKYWSGSMVPVGVLVLILMRNPSFFSIILFVVGILENWAEFFRWIVPDGFPRPKYSTEVEYLAFFQILVTWKKCVVFSAVSWTLFFGGIKNETRWVLMVIKIYLQIM